MAEKWTAERLPDLILMALPGSVWVSGGLGV